jgi:hypothetical protein
MGRAPYNVAIKYTCGGVRVLKMGETGGVGSVTDPEPG